MCIAGLGVFLKGFKWEAKNELSLVNEPLASADMHGFTDFYSLSGAIKKFDTEHRQSKGLE